MSRPESPATSAAIERATSGEYKYGFVTEIESDTVAPGLDADVVRLISSRKKEPAWLLKWRLRALERWEKLAREQGEPRWAQLRFPEIDFQAISYYSAPKPRANLESMDQVVPELREAFDKLGIPLAEQERLSGVAVDAVFDSVSVATTFKGKLAELGIIFCSFSEAVQNHPDLVRKYLGSVVPPADNFYAALN